MTAPSSIPEHRAAVPISSFITSSPDHAAICTIDVFILPNKHDEYMHIVRPVVHKIRAHPESLFCEISVHPKDKGHIRIVQGWTKDSEWIREVRLAY
jgi:hypothetical protein